MDLQRFDTDPSPISFGAFGTAFKAFDKVEKKFVCLKNYFPKEWVENKEYVLQKTELLSKLDHPNIIKYLGHFVQDEKLSIVLEFIDGGDLRGFLKKNRAPLPEEIISSFLSQLVSGLLYLHSRDIIHRDLKPENILLTKDNKVKIIDFNASKMISKVSPGQTKVGTPLYMPPEIISVKDQSFSVDVWSLGCVICELMTGNPPFKNDDEMKLADMILTQDPPLIEGNYSPVLKFIVMKMLEKDPNERINLKDIKNFLPSTEQVFQLQAKIQDLEQQNSKLQEKIKILESEKSQQQLVDEKGYSYVFYRPQIEQWIGEKEWTLLYRATKDGFKAEKFHSLCNKQGPTLSVITSKEGFVFGGYTPVSWDNSIMGTYREDSSKQSFIFTLTNPHNIPPTKYPLTQQEKAIYCFKDFGPVFGSGHDILVENSSDHNTKSFIKFPKSYSDTTGKGNITFTGSKTFSAKEIEVYKISD